MNFQPSSAKANNLRLQQPHFGHLSASAAVRFLVGGVSIVGLVVQLVAPRVTCLCGAVGFTNSERCQGANLLGVIGVIGSR